MLSFLKNLGMITCMAATVLIIGCENKQENSASPAEVIKVGTIAGPETQLMETAKVVAKQKYNLDIEIIQFQDYATPNTSLSDGAIDANAFQTQQYLETLLNTQGYDLVSVGKTFIYPMGAYSKKITNLAQLQSGASIAIPNDPSNEQRALILLEKVGLIKLRHTSEPMTPESMTAGNIVENPLNLNILTLDAAQLPRALDDVDLAVINSTFLSAVSADATKIFTEGNDSPYVNVIVTRGELVHDPRILHLVAAYQSPEVAKTAETLFKGEAIPAWDTAKK